ncbi:MAG: hypothetical protein NTW50_04425 [Candidatus Berkelbacteria bacterium]|nr:hypothetical protein [Candidatus Berkelbacteria bacterium]
MSQFPIGKNSFIGICLPLETIRQCDEILRHSKNIKSFAKFLTALLCLHAQRHNADSKVILTPIFESYLDGYLVIIQPTDWNEVLLLRGVVDLYGIDYLPALIVYLVAEYYQLEVSSR